MANHITLVASLVGDIKYATFRKDNGEGFRASFSVAQNQNVFNKETNSYEDIPPKFWNITVFDNIARSLEKSNIPKGSPLLIQGELTLREVPEYTDKNGVVHPKEIVNQIQVTNIGALIGRGRSVNVILTKNVSGGTTQVTSQPSAPVQTVSQTVQSESQNNNSFNFGDSGFDEDDIFG